MAAGAIDIAAIDAVTFSLIARYQPARIVDIRVLGFTERVAGLPFITSARTSAADLAALRRGLAALFAAPLLADIRDKLLLAGCSFPPES